MIFLIHNLTFKDAQMHRLNNKICVLLPAKIVCGWQSPISQTHTANSQKCI